MARDGLIWTGSDRAEVSVSIRRALPTDRDAFVSLCLESGIGGGRESIESHFSHPLLQAYVALEEDDIVGTGLAALHGARTGWLGLVAVAPSHRRRGTGQALTEFGVKLLRDRGARSWILTATESGLPLYERLGFRRGPDYIAFEGRGTTAGPDSPALRALYPTDRGAIESLDFSATGERRGPLLATMRTGKGAADSEGRLRGFCIPSPWGTAASIALDEEAGVPLLDAARGIRGDQPMRIVVPEANAAALAALSARGFREVRRCPYMVLGEWPEPYRPERIWGCLSFAVG